LKKKTKKKVPVGFRSEFEFDVSQKLQPCGFKYEPNSIPYTVPRKYTPDFVFTSDTQTTYIECKGYFRAGDTQKYVAIKNCLSWTEELVFVLMKPDQKVNKQTKLTMSQWCDKHRIKWYSIETLQELIDYVSHA
jgi:hypothetical protein